MMLIEETYINDINFDDADAAKFNLAESVIGAFTPFFSDEIERKTQKLRDCKSDLIQLKTVMNATAEEQARLNAGIARQGKIGTILNELEILFNHNILFGKNKELAKAMFMRINELSDVELDKSVLLLRKMVSQNIKQVIPR